MIEGRRVEYEPVLSNEPDSPQDYNEFPYARFVPAKHGNYVEPNNMGYSDYGGSTIERSNVRVFMREFAEHQGTEWWHLYGAHGTSAIVVRIDADDRVPEMGEFFDALESYPLADENDHSKLEMDEEDEAWGSYGLTDFRRWIEDENLNLTPLFPRKIAPIIGALPDETVVTLFEQLLRIDLEDPDESRLAEIFFEGVRNGRGEEVRHGSEGVYFDYPRTVQSYLSHVIDQNGLRVALDALLESGGEWSPMIDRLVDASRREDR